LLLARLVVSTPIFGSDEARLVHERTRTRFPLLQLRSRVVLGEKLSSFLECHRRPALLDSHSQVFLREGTEHSLDSFVLRFCLDTHFIQIGRFCDLLAPLKLLRDDQVLSEDSHDQVKLLKVFPDPQSDGSRLDRRSVYEDVAVENSLVKMIHRADEENVEVAQTDSSFFHVLVVVAQFSKLPMQILSVLEHKENLEDDSLVLIASRHLNHEEEDAKFVESKPALNLGLGQESRGNPLINPTQHCLHVQLLRAFVLDYRLIS